MMKRTAGDLKNALIFGTNETAFSFQVHRYVFHMETQSLHSWYSARRLKIEACKETLRKTPHGDKSKYCSASQSRRITVNCAGDNRLPFV